MMVKDPGTGTAKKGRRHLGLVLERRRHPIFHFDQYCLLVKQGCLAVAPLPLRAMTLIGYKCPNISPIVC